MIISLYVQLLVKHMHLPERLCHTVVQQDFEESSLEMVHQRGHPVI